MRIAIKIALCVLGLLLLVVLAVLPAHWQARHIEPPLPTVSQLRALLHRSDGPSAIHYINTVEQPTAEGLLTHSAFVVEWPSGASLVIDLGMSVATAQSFSKLVATLVDAKPAVVHGTVATLLGDAVQRVGAVAYTHLHRDHTDGTPEFCAAYRRAKPQGTVLLLQTHWQADEHNFTTRGGARTVRESCLQPAPLEGDIIQTSRLFPGLGIVALGGHTPDSTLFAVPVGDTLYLLSGDITNSKAEIRSDTPKPLLYSYLMVPEHAPRSALLRKWLAGLGTRPGMRVVVSHDLEDIRSSGITPIGPP